MVALTHRGLGAAAVPGSDTTSGPLYFSASTKALYERFRDAMKFDAAGQAAQQYWLDIERAQATRPDLMRWLVQVCERHNISLEELYAKAAEPQALTMYMVVASAAVGSGTPAWSTAA